MQILRQSTQIKVKIGPVVAVGDGFTPVTNLTLSGADEAELLKHDASSTTDISGATFAAITGADGCYNLTLTTSHTDTVGMLDISINDDSLVLPVLARFQVVEEAVYDALYAASAPGYGTAQTGDSYAVVNSGTFGNAALKTLIDAVKAKTDNLPSDPADASDIASSFSSIASTLTTIAGYIDTEVAAIKAKTDNLPADPADASDISASFTSLAATLTTIAGYVDTEVAAIKKLVEADVLVDTGESPWELVWIERGTGGIGVGTELMRKAVKTTAGNGITDTATVVGQLVHAT